MAPAARAPKSAGARAPRVAGGAAPPRSGSLDRRRAVPSRRCMPADAALAVQATAEVGKRGWARSGARTGVRRAAAMGASCQRPARARRQVYKMHLVEGRAATGPAVDSARQNLASTFVNAFVNAGFGTDKLMTGACPLARGALQALAERLASVATAQETPGMRCRRSCSAVARRQQRAALPRAHSRVSCGIHGHEQASEGVRCRRG